MRKPGIMQASDGGAQLLREAVPAACPLFAEKNAEIPGTRQSAQEQECAPPILARSDPVGTTDPRAGERLNRQALAL